MENWTGRFNWYELATTDLDAAVAFYGETVGWTFEDSGAEHPYRLLKADGREVGGMMAMPPGMEGMPPIWTGYIAVADVDAAAKAVAEDGGAVLNPAQAIPDVGRFAVVADPQGAAFILFQPDDPSREDALPDDKAGFMGWHNLATSDVEAAWEFYEKHFGWVIAEDMEVPGGVYRMFAYREGGRTRGGIGNVPDGVEPRWTYYVRVPDVNETAKKIEALAGKVTEGPMDVPGGDRIVEGTDPQGARLAYVSATGEWE